MYLPSVIEKTGRGSKAFDIPTKLLTERIIYFFGEVNEYTANSIIMQLLWLKTDDPTKDIDFYINSFGGDVYQGLAIYDVIKKLPCKVNTICVGPACSMGAFLLASGTGTRKATENSRIMIHSVSSGQQGVFHDLEVGFEETKYIQDKLINYMAEFTNGKSTLDKIKEKTLRDCWMSPEEAIEMGLIDEII